MDYLIRKARIEEGKRIHSLIKEFSQTGNILPRSLSELYDQLRDFFVCLDKEDETRLIGICAMHICWEDIAEIRSLAVLSEYRNQGIGARLVEACLSEAVTLGIYKVFVLTYDGPFFGKFGFQEIDKTVLPHKVWTDCLKCVKFPDCDETAMLLTI
jgi:amino-acid N-acetyltransferase